MGSYSTVLAPGSRVLYDGEITAIVELSGSTVTARVERTGSFITVSIAQFIRQCQSLDPVDSDEDLANGSVGAILSTLTSDQRLELEIKVSHVEQVLSGPGVLGEKIRMKAKELNIAPRTIERWISQFTRNGAAGLVDARRFLGRGSCIDPRWDEAVRSVLARKVHDSTPTRSAVLFAVNRLLDEQYEPGEIPRPSQTTAYRRLGELAKGTNAFSGSSSGRRSINERPKGVYGRLRATRPGEIIVLDTNFLDVYAMEPVTCRWVGAQLTVAQDLYSRCIVGLRITPSSTKSIDVASVLFETIAGNEPPDSWPDEAIWPYHGLPSHVVVEPNERTTGPVCAPEHIVIDNGAVYISHHVKSVCARLGISVQPAQPFKPTDKPTVERFFRTLREGLLQHLPAYKGPDVYSRGKDVEKEAFLYLHELDDIIREWIATVYHRTNHSGICIPELPRKELSPADMYAIGVGKAGLLRLPATPQLAMDFLPVAARTIQHYGIDIDNLRYNGPALNPYRNAKSPYGGALGGKWPIRYNPDDVRAVWFQDPDDNQFHRLDWEHAASLGTAFSGEAAAYARRIAKAQNKDVTSEKALADLLSRWDAGLVSGRRERRMAARMGAEYAALPIEDSPIPIPNQEQNSPPDDLVISDEDDDEDFGEGFYDEAFEVLR